MRGAGLDGQDAHPTRGVYALSPMGLLPSATLDERPRSAHSCQSLPLGDGDGTFNPKARRDEKWMVDRFYCCRFDAVEEFAQDLRTS